MPQLPSSNFKFLNLWLFVVMCLAIWLRLWQIPTLPPAPYWEEVALGYDAWSLLKTGSDHHGHSWPVVAFESFGDWKPSGYFYAVLPFLATFGLNVWAVRLPSVLAGLGLVWLIPLVIEQFLGKPLTGLTKVSVLLLAALCPWLIVFSRGAWEVNLGLFLTVLGIWWWYQALRHLQSSRFWPLGSLAILSLAGSMYTYHAFRVITPLWIFWLTFFEIWVFKKVTVTGKNLAKLAGVAICAIALVSPILLSLTDPVVNHRLQETSILTNPESVLKSNAYRELFHHSWWSRLIFHRYRYQAEIIAQNVFQHLRFDFLFVSGDANARHTGPLYGQLLYLDVLLIAVGILQLIKKSPKNWWFLVGLWLIAVLPASLTTGTPHALRTLPSVLIWLTFMAVGVEALTTLVTAWRIPRYIQQIAGIILLAAYGGIFGLWWQSYVTLTPRLFSQDWQYGYQAMIQAVEILKQESPQTSIVISRALGRPAMYWWFYHQTDPKLVQITATTAPKDQGELLRFENIQFSSLEVDFHPEAVVAMTPTQWQVLQEAHPDYELAQMSTIYSPSHHPIWLVGRLLSKSTPKNPQK